MKIHQLTAEQALESLASPAQGLTSAEAEKRLLEFGANRVEAVPREPLALVFIKEFTHFFALILWLAAGLAFFAEHQDPGQGMATLGWAILGVIVVNGLFSFWQEYRAEQAIAALQKLLPAQSKALRNNAVTLLEVDQLVPGDIILLQEGDNVPADCRLLEAFAMRVNNATVTGEALPKGRDAHPSQSEDILTSRNVLLAGTSVVSGEGRALVFATGMHTEFGKIAHLTQTEGESLSPLQLEIKRLSRIVALLAMLLGALFFLIGHWIGLSFWANLMLAIGVIVANVPEGLLPTVTLALAMATKRMAKRHALIRHLPSVETLGAASVICTDKTGTLTQNRMRVKTLWLGDAWLLPEHLPRTPAIEHYRALFEIAALCHNLKPGGQQWLGDPMEIALVNLAQQALDHLPTYPKRDEIPFDTDRKRMSTIHDTPAGQTLYCKGAMEMVLPHCAHVQTEAGAIPLDAGWQGRILSAQERMAAQGLRVLAMAYRPLRYGEQGDAREQDLIFAGLVGMEDPPRPEVPDAIRKCHTAGIKVIMVTGDHPHTALAIARQIGLVTGDKPCIIGGEELKRLSATQLQIALNAREIIFARVGADQKMRIVKALKQKRHIVAVTGDGVNDAPALKAADIGIAMGMSGTDVAKSSADMILLDDNFATIVAAIEEGRAVFDNIRKFLAYILSSNIPELVPYLAFALFKIPLPLTVVQILAVDLGTDMLPALGLGTEKPDPGVMQRPPRNRRERLLTGPLLARAYLFLGVMEAVAAMAAYFAVLHRGGWHYGEALAGSAPLYLQATAATLSAIIAMQIMNVWLCKHPDRPLWRGHLLDNPLILAGIALEIVLIGIIDYTPWGQQVFGTAALPADTWLFILPFAGAMLLLEEGRKALMRKARTRLR